MQRQVAMHITFIIKTAVPKNKGYITVYIRTNIDGTNIWQFVENIHLAKSHCHYENWHFTCCN